MSVHDPKEKQTQAFPVAAAWKAIWFEIVLFGCCAALLLSAAIGHG